MILRQSPYYMCLRCTKRLVPAVLGREGTARNVRGLVTRSTSSRPRVPFLAQSTADSRQLLLQRRVSRVLSTENKRYVKEQTWMGVKLCVAALIVVNLVGFGLSSYEGELVEKRRPSPPEWSYLTRMAWRAALEAVYTSEATGKPVDLGRVGNYWLTCLRRLETASCDGEGLHTTPLTSGANAPAARGIEALALDVTMKSEEWKAGYTEVILELGKVAESTQHLVFDRSRNEYFPAVSMIGPSNPRPRKLPAGTIPPTQENCDPAFPDPSIFYDRVIQGAGFTVRQRLSAIHALANWLHFTGQESNAALCYADAVKLAAASAPSSLPGPASFNALTAVTEQASQLARTGHLSAALPLYLSSLAAVHAARSTPPTPRARGPATPVSEGLWADLSRRLFRSDTYPLPRDGNLPLSAVPHGALLCAEATLKMYIGEILFSTSATRHDDGIAWTKEAVSTATKVLEEQSAAKRMAGNWTATEAMTGLGREGELRCRECLTAAVNNWEAMMQEMESDSQRVSEESARSWWWATRANKRRKSEEFQDSIQELEDTKAELLAKGIVGRDAFVPRI